MALLGLSAQAAAGQQLVDADRSLLQHLLLTGSAPVFAGFVPVPEIPRGDIKDPEFIKAVDLAALQAANAVRRREGLVVARERFQGIQVREGVRICAVGVDTGCEDKWTDPGLSMRYFSPVIAIGDGNFLVIRVHGPRLQPDGDYYTGTMLTFVSIWTQTDDGRWYTPQESKIGHRLRIPRR